MRPGTAKAVDSGVILRGPYYSTLLRFALPIILGNLLQHLYSLVDAIVVGRYLGDLPLAGISVAAPMMDILTALIIGGTIGMGVLVGRQVGAGDYSGLKKTLSTSLLGGLCITAALSLLGILLDSSILLRQGTDPAVCREASLYLTIIFAGSVFSFLYNYYATILRAYGNSRVPFAVLFISAALNIGLDILFVGVLGAGIWGVAVATVLCQLISAGCCCIYIHKKCPPLRLVRGEFGFFAATGKTILSYAWAGALQQAVVCIARFLIQGMLNVLGTDTITGYNMAMRTEQFLFCFSTGISAAMTVCISQNMGAGNIPRVRRFYLTGIVVNLLQSAILGLVCFFFPAQLIGVFSQTPAVIEAGVSYTGFMALFYPLAFAGEIIQSFYRGISRMRITMIASVSQVIVRVTLCWLLVPTMGIRGIFIAVLTGWAGLVLVEGSLSLRRCRKL